MAFLLKLRKVDLLDIARELGVEAHGDLRKVEIKDKALQNKNYDMEAIKAVMQEVLEENKERGRERKSGKRKGGKGARKAN
ncbi:hypothetical protein TNCT_646731 [Trichonephila clavata]|uniref:Uncharacterized protein n=1 Tax=Trichonephila clavata TaxID=2740835 RepID=A0A8X6G1D8_TRICU|nr:hypothetical protein TNCT_646731 [Trichonephila clavata]